MRNSFPDASPYLQAPSLQWNRGVWRLAIPPMTVLQPQAPLEGQILLPGGDGAAGSRDREWRVLSGAPLDTV